MKFLELVNKRYSARSYKADKVEKEKIDYILECVRRAPSAVNCQPWHFLIIRNEENRNKIQQCYAREWFKTAPVYIVVCTDKSAAWARQSDGKSHADIDAAIATEHICLAAADAGLGSCWVCNFNTVRLAHDFQLPAETYPVAIIPIGYVDEQPQTHSSRKAIEEIATFL